MILPVPWRREQGAVEENTRKHRALGGLHLAGAVAIRASLCRGARLSPCAIAIRALFHPVDRDLFFTAKRRLFKSQVQVDLYVLAAAGPVTPGLRPHAAAKKAVKNAAQVKIFEAAVLGIATAAGPVGGIDPCMAELVVSGLFFRVRQNLIGGIDLFHLLLGFFVAGVSGPGGIFLPAVDMLF